MDMFHQNDCTETPQSSLGAVVSQTYEESVRDLIHDERHYIRDLHMIIKVTCHYNIRLRNSVLTILTYVSISRYI